jgi:hypothetical protein
MKKFISLTVASLVIAASLPSVGQAQTSVPTNPDVAPNNLPATPAPGGNTGPNSVTPTTPGTVPDSTMPATPSTTMPATAMPSASTMGTCGMKMSSTGVTSTGTSMPSSGGGTLSTGSGTGMTSSSNSSETYKTSTASSVVPLMKLNTNPALSTTSSSTTTSTTPAADVAPRLLDASSDQIEYNNLIGPAHYIKLAVGSSPLCYLSVTPLQDVYAVDSIRVLDQSGKGVPATVTKLDNGSAKISFDQPISSGSNLVLALQGVEYDSTITPTTVQYYVSGGFANYDQEIPYGVAQVQRFLR